MDSVDKETRNTFAGVFASHETIEQMNYWEARDMARKLRTYSETCELEERESISASIVLADKRASALAGNDGSYDQDDLAHKNAEIVKDHLARGDLKGALELSEELKKSGQAVPNVTINKEASKSYYEGIKKQRDERVPAIMKDLNLNQDQAEQWFNDHESMDRWQNRPSALGPDPEPAKPKPKETGSLPSDSHDGQWSSKP